MSKLSTAVTPPDFPAYFLHDELILSLLEFKKGDLISHSRLNAYVTRIGILKGGKGDHIHIHHQNNHD